MNFLVTYSNKYLNFPQCITFLFVSHYRINMNLKKCVDSLQIQCFILKNDQNFKSSPKIKISHSLVLLYLKL
jgi:predicted component of type VI protein secretion system